MWVNKKNKAQYINISIERVTEERGPWMKRMGVEHS